MSTFDFYQLKEYQMQGKTSLWISRKLNIPLSEVNLAWCAKSPDTIPKRIVSLP